MQVDTVSAHSFVPTKLDFLPELKLPLWIFWHLIKLKSHFSLFLNRPLLCISLPCCLFSKLSFEACQTCLKSDCITTYRLFLGVSTLSRPLKWTQPWRWNFATERGNKQFSLPWKKLNHGHLLLCTYHITASILRALLACWAALAIAVVLLLCKENFSHETSRSFT